MAVLALALPGSHLPASSKLKSEVRPIAMKLFTPLLCLCLTAVTTSRAPAQTVAQTNDQAIDPALGISTLPLWPAGAPQVAGTPTADLPTLTVFAPQKGKATGSAVIIAPGGAYLGLASNLEGRQVADWFTSLGMTAFVLKYRLGAKYLYPIPLEDAQRSVRLVRSLATAYGFAPDRIGFVRIFCRRTPGSSDGNSLRCR